MVKLADYNKDRGFEYEISGIQVHTDPITSNSAWVKMNSHMNLSDRGTLESTFLIDLTHPEDMTLDLTISNLMLEDFDVYCREATGYPLNYGDMYLKSHMDFRNDSLKSQNDIIIHNMKLGKRGHPIGPPLKFAMFLLKDKDQVIHFNIQG